MRTFLAAAFLVAAGLFFSPGGEAQTSDSRYLAFCIDGDAELSDWLYNRTDAYRVARDHQRLSSGHRWEIFVQGVEVNRGSDESCWLMTPGRREGTMKIENVCSECRVFKVQRAIGSEPAVEKDLEIKPGGRRFFRVPAESKVAVLEERECSGP